MKKSKKIMFIVLLLLLSISLFGFIAMNKIVDTANHTSIQNVDVATMKDGEYIGSYEILPVQVDVSVIIKQHKITNIKLDNHMNGLGSKAEIIPDEVIKAQSLDVDTISGATVSSKCILKAIEVAIVQGEKQ